MNKRLLTIIGVSILIALPLSLLCLFHAWADIDYCREPPFISSGVQSNVLVIMDNSMSMGELAYKEDTGQYGTTSSPEWVDCPPSGSVATTMCDPQCSTADDTSKQNCQSRTCTGRISWNCQANNGECQFQYKCAWIADKRGGGGTCTRSLVKPQSGDCWAMAEPDEWKSSWDVSDPDNPKVVISINKTSSGMSKPAYMGYIPTKKYYGYFDPDKLYKYSNENGKHYFYTGDGSEWNPVGVDVNLVGPDGKTTVTTRIYGASTYSAGRSDKFYGNWLNWLLMRRIDIAKKVLTGGRLGGDPNNYVLVATPHTDRDEYKIFNDIALINQYGNPDKQGQQAVYYTPFGQGFGAYIYSNMDLAQRTGYDGAFVPLVAFFQADFSSAKNANTKGMPEEYSLGDTTNPLWPGAFGNPGEDWFKDSSGGSQRTYPGSYYVAVLHSAVSDKKPPTGIVQNMISRVRLGLMVFNYGLGPAEGYPLGGCPDGVRPDGTCYGFNPNGDGLRQHNYGYRYADGGRIVNGIADRSQVASWQNQLTGLPDKDGNIPGDGKVPIYSIVKNINETLCITATPLAETLREAMNYFRQNNPSYAWVDSDGTFQVDFEVDKGGVKDPYYWLDPTGAHSGLSKCLKSYIILVTGGGPTGGDLSTFDHPCQSGCTHNGEATCDENNCSRISKDFRFNDVFLADINDPSKNTFLDDIAFKIYMEDNRPPGDIPGDTGNQTISLYTVFAFSTSDAAKEYLQRASLAGGFNDLNKDLQPGKAYPASCDPCSISAIVPWTAEQSRNCCNWRDSYNYTNYNGYYEWDTDANGNPDHFFEAQDGYLLEKYLQSILSQIALGGAAGAVATISQQTREGDAIIRGAFDAADPNDRSRYLWNGRLEVYWPDETGEYEFDYASNVSLFCSQMADVHCPGEGDPSGRCCWDAAEKMKKLDSSARGTRKIFTYLQNRAAADRQTDFTINNWSYFQGLMRQPVTDCPTAPCAWKGVQSEDEVKAVIQWTRGIVDSQGYPIGNTSSASGRWGGTPPIGPYRDRKGYLLGDIVYSTPVIVGPPPLASVSGADRNLARTVSDVPVDYQDGAEAFWAFRNYWLESPSDSTYKGRPKIAYVGANDGMLHAFLIARLKKDTGEWDYNCTAEGSYPACGADLWSYIPSNLLGELLALAQPTYGTETGCKHRTMVDLSPRAWDVFINSPDCTTTRPSPCGDKRCWRTIIIGGERGGGDTYFALDVTDPDPTKVKVLWEYPALKNLVAAYDEGGQIKIALPFRENDSSNDDAICSSDTWPDGWSDTCFDSMYFKLRTLPMSWNRAALGRVRIPSDVGFFRYVYGDSAASDVYRTPDAPTLSKTAAFSDCDNKRHIAFIGTGFQIFDYAQVSPPISESLKSVLTKPQLLAIDVETGQNYFQVVWPLAVKARTDAGLFPDPPPPLTSSPTLIPWAFGQPSLVDVWDNQDRDTISTDDVSSALNGRFAEDGFVDRLYVGDLRGFLYRMAFNLKDYGKDNSSHHKGMNVEFWPTKPIPDPDPSNINDPGTCDQTNNYRGCRQPITVAPMISYDLGSASTDSPKLRAVFGTGKFDKVTGDRDDKTDLTKMSFYNLAEDIKSFCTSDASGEKVCEALPTIAPTAAYSISIESPATTAVVTPSGSNPEKGFVVDGTNFGLTFGTGVCQDESASPYDHYRNCTETTTSCDAATMARICGDPADPACEADCTQTTNRDTCCNWVKSGGGIDCCQGLSCTRTWDSSTPSKCTPCWDCIYDFATPGERVISDPLIAFGLVFFTTYVPTDDPCSAGGHGWLYMLDYRCQPLNTGFNPVFASFGHTVVQLPGFGAKVDLGSGMPSEPVMDSTGQYIFVQKSDATVVKIGAGGGAGSGGSGSSFRDVQFKGWDRR